MSVNGVSSASNPYPPSTFDTSFKATSKEFSALADAVNSGDVSAAQSAFSTFQTDLQKSKGGAALLNSNGTLGKDFQALQSAMNSGDIKGIQSAFQTLQQDMSSVQGAGQHHHRHHHHQGGTTDATVGANGSTIPPLLQTPDASGQQTTGTNVNKVV